MDNFTENTDKHSLYVLRNFTAVTFATLLIAGSTLSILGITMTIVPKWFNIMLLLLTVSGATLALLRRISRATLLSFCIIVFAIELSGEMVYLATQSSYHAILYISADATQALSIILLSLTGLNKRVVAIAGSIVFITWSTVCLIVKGDLWDIYVINAVIFAAATLYGYFAIERIIDVVARYNDLTEERNMMHAMQHMTRDQLNALIKLGLKKNQTPEETQQLLRAAGADAQHIINENVSAVVRQQIINEQLLAEHLPELTTTELQVAKAILMKLQLSEMITMTGKSKGNITTIRSRIRRKLKLAPTDQLYNSLFLRVFGTQPRSMKM
jgi:membrane protein